jgi:hypothetical protein
MKKFRTVLLIGVGIMVLMQPLHAMIRGNEPVPVRSKNKDLYVFRTDRKFKGANVEILSSNGDRLTTQTLEKRKMIIDFTDVKEGSYKIRLSKGDQVKEFKYEKK